MIFVFKTSVKTIEAVRQLKPYLDKLLQQLKWNFDLDDCDKILRLDTSLELSGVVVKLLREKGYDCEELSD